ncbi:hypothetical protein [Jongsikchunia kroppenstedtii]|uniref:hypothetical protein n=1 Tax=Jongsikchunia kroppenstedtii TaxID=1121721 RepID=UPI00037CC8C2|nr:hypothetical protein [Jongsikchunia kroppenstedtii]
MTTSDIVHPPEHRGAPAALGCWSAAWLAGFCSPDDLLDSVSGWGSARLVPADAQVAQRYALNTDDDLAALLPLLRRADAITSLLPAAGSPSGLPPASPVTTAALQAGEVLLIHTDHDEHYALVPHLRSHVEVEFQLHSINFAAPPLTMGLGETEYQLRQAVRDAAERLARIGSTGGTIDDPRARLLDLQQQAARLRPPPGSNERATRVLDEAARIDAILQLSAEAATDFGVTAGHHADGDDTLRDLAGVVRDARMTAVNTIIGEFLARRA